ncbi:MAG: hypothetical protein ACRD3T_06030 [Terriglobia bacterium]
MKRLLGFVAAVCLILFPVSAVRAQEHPKTVAVIVNATPKPGMQQQWEAALKKVVQWRRQHNDPWTRYVWEVMSGDETGTYVVGSFGHDWKDFDEESKLMQGDPVASIMDPVTQSHEYSYSELLTDISSMPTGGQPSPYLELTSYSLKPGAERDVIAVIKQANAAEKKTNYPSKPSAWYSLLNGGPSGTLVVVSARNNWADFQPPTQSFSDMIASVYGKAGDEALRKTFFRSIRASTSAILRYRPDLSYIAAAP